MLRPLSVALILGLALFGRDVYGQDDEDYDAGANDYPSDYDEGDYGGAPPDDDYGGGGGEQESSGEVAELISVDEFDAFLDDADASIIGCFLAKDIIDPTAVMPEGWDEEEDGKWEAPKIENPALASFKSITSGLYGYRFATTTAAEVLSKMKCKSDTLYLYRSPRFVSVEHGDRPRERFPSSTLTENAVSNWLSSKAQPLVGLYSSSTKHRYSGAPVLIIFLNLDFESNAKSITYVLKRARKVAAAFKGKLRVAVAAIVDSTYDLGEFGLVATKPSVDILMGVQSAAGGYYPAVGTAFTAAALTELASGYLEGKVEEYIKPVDESVGGEGDAGLADDEAEGMPRDEDEEEDEAKDEM